MEIREKEQVKQRVQRRIVLCSVMLMAGKFAAYFLTNSVGVLTDAMESIVNVTAGLISLYSLYRAARPADRNHPFGYGKIELISASIEGLLILLAGAAIVYEGIRRLFVPELAGKGIDLMLCGHYHRYHWIDDGSRGVDFPILVNSNNDCLRVSADAKGIDLKVVNTAGAVIKQHRIDKKNK